MDSPTSGSELRRPLYSRECYGRFVSLLLLILSFTASMHSEATLRSGDAYIRHDHQRWVIGTPGISQTLQFADAHLWSVSLKNLRSGTEYQPQNGRSPEVRFLANGADVSALEWHWTLSGQRSFIGKSGELYLEIELACADFHVTKHYVIYPGTSLIREWLTILGQSTKPVRVSHLDFWYLRLGLSDSSHTEFNYLTGGGNFNGSQLLKSEAITPRYSRTLDANGGIQAGNYSSFLPLVFVRNRDTRDGLAVGWDYLGHWRLDIDADSTPLKMGLQLAGFAQALGPGAAIESPQAFIGTFSGGIDELGNELLDWQYKYLWDFTNPEYFAKTRWAVDWPDPWVGAGGAPSADNWGRRLALDLRYIDLLRETGTDILWDDAGWYDKWGTWTSPDWRRTNDYLRKYDMRWVLWYPTFLATPESRVAQQHPNWLIPGQDTLEQSIAGTASWQNELLKAAVNAWGNFQWRYDIAPAASANDTDALAADQNFRKLLLQFKTDHPGSAVDACDGGGRWISYELARMAESGEYTDGGVGPYSAYYTSLLIPPDKLHNVVDLDHTYYDATNDHTHLAMDPTWYRDPGDGPNIESIRKEWELYHYFVAQGAAGRWSHIFRPRVLHDDPIWYFQRMNQDGSKGVILTKHAKQGPTYFVVSRALDSSGSFSSKDEYEGNAGEMNQVITTTKAASIESGVYEDPVDGLPRYYGVDNQQFGPLNLKYQVTDGDWPLVSKIERHGVRRVVTKKFFGMALQVSSPMTITALGQFDPGNNRGRYRLSVIRASDGKILGTGDLDMSRSHPDSMGFKYARLNKPLRLESSLEPIVIFPGGLLSNQIYDVTTSISHLHFQRTGADLTSKGIQLDSVSAGELIFLNMPSYPGNGTDHTPPTAPTDVTKRVGSNLGVQGIEVSWSPSQDDNWISYYEVRRDRTPIGRVAKGTFFFDHTPGARNQIDADFEVVAVDGDGNRSIAVTASKISGEPRRYEALGDFSPTQSLNHWDYEELVEDDIYQPLLWDKGGYEGRWQGSGLGRIGRIWMQPSAQYDLSRTFIVPSTGYLDTAGEVRKDPSAENGASCFIRILLNADQIWPQQGWAEVLPKYEDPINYAISGLKVKAGDKVRFLVRHSGSNRLDPIVWNPVVTVRNSDSATVSP